MVALRPFDKTQDGQAQAFGSETQARGGIFTLVQTSRIGKVKIKAAYEVNRRRLMIVVLSVFLGIPVGTSH